MTLPKVLPGLLVAHDPLGEAAADRVRWVIEGAGDTIVGCNAADFTATIAEVALKEVGAYDSFLVIHVIGPLEDPGLEVFDRGADPVDALLTALSSVHESLRQRFPGQQRIDQWVIHTVGQVIDESEHQFIEQVARSADAGLRGVIVSASATHVSVTHDDAEQACFAADIALALLGSDMERYLAEAAPIAWVGGAASLTYAGVRVGEAISAYHGLRLLEEHLLTDSPAGDPAFDLGEQWVEDLDLPGARERDLLLASAKGGSLLTGIRMEGIDWETVPITSWSDVLTTHQMLLVSQGLDEIRKVIEANRLKRVEELKASIIAHSFEELESSIRFESAITFDRGVLVGLEKAAQAIPEASRGVDPDLVDRDRAKLRRFTRWLPFGPAVALRLFAAALGALVVVSARTGPSDLPVLGTFTKPWGRVAALVVLLVGFLLYQRRLKTTLKVRDRLNAALEQQLVDTVEQCVVDARLQALMELRAWIGTRPDWLDEGAVPTRPEEAATLVEWFAWLVHESRLSRDRLRARVADRRDLSGVRSRYAVDIPLTDLLSTEELAEQLLPNPPEPREGARNLVVLIRPVCQADALRVLSKDELEPMWIRWLGNRLGPQLWQDLGALLTERPSIRDAARRTIEANTTPALATRDNAPSVGTRHYLALPGGRTGSAYLQLFSSDIESGAIPAQRVSDSLTGVLDIRIPDVALMVHLYALDLDESPSEATDANPDHSAPETDEANGL